MKPYGNKGGNSGIRAYEIGDDFIKLKFSDKEDVYVYDYDDPGRAHVNEMKKFALKGKGLATYVNKWVRGNYSRIE
ncbi:MAG: hypothetical protein K0Q95_2288 [Bacteroidota bacterium]|jgi:hypothetical protein|nr:hypothetical protein [Bacteroidota bacterium]